jgi:hypothetical protein
VLYKVLFQFSSSFLCRSNSNSNSNRLRVILVPKLIDISLQKLSMHGTPKTTTEAIETLVSNSQYGGTAILSLGKTSFYAAGSGTDPKHLGRWCWTRYQGKHNLTLRVISFYRPCASNSPGERTVTATQERCMPLTNDDRSARQAFLEDFRAAIEEWKTEGDALIICGDINENIRSQAVTSYFEDLGLRHLIFSKHDPATAPATYYHNRSGYAVDSIWASPCLDLVCGGYLGQGVFPGNHRPIWFELSYEQVTPSLRSGNPKPADFKCATQDV